MLKTAPQITAGSRVRVILPNWTSPGMIVYTVEMIAGDEAIVREPRVPGLKGETRVYQLSQLVAA